MKTWFWVALWVCTATSLHAENPNFLLVWQTIFMEVNGTNIEYQATARTHNKQGHLTGTVTDTDTDLDGTMDERSCGSGDYDNYGNRTNWVAKTVSLTSGQVLSIYNDWSGYDRRGQLTNAISQFDRSGDGTVDWSARTAYEFDHQGNLVGIQQESQAADFTESTKETRWYNQRGDILGFVIVRTNPVRPPSTTRATWNYDNRGLPSSRVIRFDSDGDGVADGVVLETTFLHEASGLRVEDFTRVLDADGRVVASSTVRYTFDQHRNPIYVREASDDDGDGTMDRVVEINQGYVHR